MNLRNMGSSERTLLFGTVGAGAGSLFGAALLSALGILGIVVFAFIGAAAGVLVAFLYRGDSG